MIDIKYLVDAGIEPYTTIYNLDVPSVYDKITQPDERKL